MMTSHKDRLTPDLRTNSGDQQKINETPSNSTDETVHTLTPDGNKNLNVQ